MPTRTLRNDSVTKAGDRLRRRRRRCVAVSLAAGLAFQLPAAALSQTGKPAGPGDDAPKVDETVSQEASSSVARPPTPEFQRGAAVFMKGRCFVCHGEQGFGGAGPRLRENRFLGLGDYVVGQILVGRKIMPAFADVLNDEEIAAVATYIRNAWGNGFGTVEPQQVAAARERMQVVRHPDEQPETPSTSQQPEGAPMPPYSVLPPGQPLPPADLAQK